MEFYNISTHMEIQTQTSPLQIWFWDGISMVKKGTLPPNTNWLVTKYAIDNGKVYYQVATNQYTTVANKDTRVVKYLKKKDMIVTIQTADKLHDFDVIQDTGNRYTGSTSQLYEGASFTTDRIMLCGNYIYYRIGINMWINSAYVFSNNKSGLIDVQSNQSHKVITTEYAIVYKLLPNGQFKHGSLAENINTAWLATKVQSDGKNNYFRIGGNMWLIDNQVCEVNPYSMIIRINSLTPRIKNFQLEPLVDTFDFGSQILSKAYVENPFFSGYLLTNGSFISIGDADGTTLMYGNYLG